MNIRWVQQGVGGIRMKKLGVCSWSLQSASWRELVDHLTQCGLSRTQVALEPFVSGGWDVEEIMDQRDVHNVSFLSGMMETIGEDYSTLESIEQTGGIRSDEHWENNQQRAKYHARVARRLGLGLVTFHAGFIPKSNTAEYTIIIDRIQRVADIFDQLDIRIALETGQEHAEELLELLAYPHLSQVGINFDPANMILYGMGDPTEAIKLLKDRIVQVHMKDAIKSLAPGTWGEEVPAGEGEVDWGSFFDTIAELPEHVHVLIERESGTKRVQDIIQARNIANTHGCH